MSNLQSGSSAARASYPTTQVRASYASEVVRRSFPTNRLRAMLPWRTKPKKSRTV